MAHCPWPKLVYSSILNVSFIIYNFRYSMFPGRQGDLAVGSRHDAHTIDADLYLVHEPRVMERESNLRSSMIARSLVTGYTAVGLT